MVLRTTKGTKFYIDDEDYEKIRGYNFYDHKIKHKNGTRIYVMCSNQKLLHRIICPTPKGKEVDHIDNDPLNNRKANLRVATRSQNSANTGSLNKTSIYKGVSRCSRGWGHGHLWRAQITKNGKCIKIGRYETEEEAATAYDKKAKEVHGEYARTNKMLGLL